MALRIKSHWHNDEADHSIDEVGGAIAYICWRIAVDRAINQHGKDFIYEDDTQRMDVIQEYLFFLAQIADRFVYHQLEANQRRKVITKLALGLAHHVQDNCQDLFGAGDYGRPFIEKLNERGQEYSVFQFTDEGPSYPFLRHLGYEIQTVMGDSSQNRWVIDQVMDKDGPEITRQLTRAIRDLFE